ncbi:MAG TPA: hypothetical protein VFZ09_28755 [Archangium sp.]|uniref:hypothetical protein n=1 Tax=Archangium sp. TaxID=1872627 RepID=UPI002E379453|nr:hypothetical protein [Archangium sp.]HEX5750256.1 hypothetical protein [Archangium sp.]
MSGEGIATGPSAYRHVYLLDYLMRMRGAMQKGLLAMYLGDIDVTRMVAFTDGYRACQSANGVEDEEYGLFRDWLRDVKQEFPTEGWAAKYLRDCDGDHERAIRKFLDFAAEFVALRERERQGS